MAIKTNGHLLFAVQNKKTTEKKTNFLKMNEVKAVTQTPEANNAFHIFRRVKCLNDKQRVIRRLMVL